MAKNVSNTIAVREKLGDSPRKLIKVIGYRNQGFAVVMPYHMVQGGYIGKVPVDYNRRGKYWVRYKDIIGFNAENRVKLSYHPDGFVQFSGEFQGKIISGRDPNTGEPRGIGLMTQPLSDPIRTGPTFGVASWGLYDFEELSDSDDAVIFEPEDMYYRDCKPTKTNGFLLEVFVFPKSYWSAVHKRNLEYILTMLLPSLEAPYASFEMKVLDLPNQDILLAGIMSCVTVTHPSKSGWTLGGPGQRDISGKGYVLSAWYPKPAKLGLDSPSLDRSPDISSPVRPARKL
jgi:hypothetical protein